MNFKRIEMKRGEVVFVIIRDCKIKICEKR